MEQPLAIVRCNLEKLYPLVMEHGNIEQTIAFANAMMQLNVLIQQATPALPGPPVSCVVFLICLDFRR